MSQLPSGDPRPNAETREFWEATREGRLLLGRCDACARVIWYPRAFCPACHSDSTSSFEASGAGTVYSYTVVRRGRGAWREVSPYVVAYVELDEGPRLLTNLVDVDPDAVEIDMRVSIRFDRSENGYGLARFAPA